MEMIHDVPEGKGWAANLLTTDFCPWANRFVYWLKEPVGWFVLATAASVLIGLYLAPIGWVLAASLTSLIAIGMLWPAIAVRVVTCSLRPSKTHLHEDDSCDFKLAVRNRLPIPVWGLAVEGYLDGKRKQEDESHVPTVALAYVRALATSTYRFSIRPDFRGHYPDGDTVLTCSFPFGIWTAERKLKEVVPVTVWPKVFPMCDESDVKGKQASHLGAGNRHGRTGDFFALREYRHGDCVRQVNWTATARSGDLVVSERSGPQSPSLLVIVDSRNERSNRDELADRVRVAASILANLHHAGVPLRLQINKQIIGLRQGHDGFTQLMNALTDIPADGNRDVQTLVPPRESASIVISSDLNGDITACLCDPEANRRLSNGPRHRLVCRDQGLEQQLLSFWSEVHDANLVA